MEKQKNKTPSPAPVATPELRCVRNTDKTYGLYLRASNGKMSPVSGLGPSVRPYEIMAEFPLRNRVAVKKYIRTERGIEPCLYLIHTDNYKSPIQLSNSAPVILYDERERKFCMPDDSAHTQYEYIMMLLRLITQLQVSLNIPTGTSPSIIQILASAPGRKIKRARLHAPHKKHIKKRVRTRTFAKKKRTRQTQSNTAPKKPDIIVPYNLTPGSRIQYMSRAHKTDRHRTPILAPQQMPILNAAAQNVR